MKQRVIWLLFFLVAGCATVESQVPAPTMESKLEYQKRAIDKLFDIGEEVKQQNEALKRENKLLHDIIDRGFVCI